MKIVFYILIVFTLGVQTVWAEFVENDHRYVYVNEPILPRIFGQEGVHEEITRIGMVVLKDLLTKLQDKKLLYDLTTIEELEQALEGEEKVRELTQRFSSNIAKLKNSVPVQLDDNLLEPSGFFVFGGGKGSFNKIVGGGVSVSVGMVFVPMKQTVFDRKTGNKIRTRYTVDTDIIFWGAPSVGLGAGAGNRGRFGVGLFWSPDQELDDADDFKGYGVSVSKTLGAFGTALNFKGGVINSPNLEGFKDLVYLSAAWAPGISATAELHISGDLIFSSEKVLGLFQGRLKEEAEAEKSKIEQQIGKYAGELFQNMFQEMESNDMVGPKLP